MNKNQISIVGNKQCPRNDTRIVSINKFKSLYKILNEAGEIWDDFDKWEDLSSQKLVFDIAVEVFKGKKIDIYCGCCEYSDNSKYNYNDKFKLKCNGAKILFIIEKIVEEIVVAKAIRENGGTYLN